MPKTKISEFSATPANNTDIDSINIAEGCAPSGINDAIRELMAQLKDFQTGAVGDSFNGPVGTSTAAAGAFTTLSASSTVSGTGFSTYLASPPAIGGTAAAAGAFTTLSASGNVTLSGGTANGVAYLNGSKVVTSGSALTFDGTNLGVGTSNPAAFGLFALNGASASANINASTGSAALKFYEGSGTGRGSITSLNGSDGLAFLQGTTEGMRLTSTGLGIGTSSPAGKLHVSGQTRIADSSSASNYILIGSGANAPRGGNSVMAQTGSMVMGTEAASNLLFITNATEAARLDSTGNLGLGVTPSAWSSSFKALQVSPRAALWGDTSQTILSHNIYATSGGDLYIANGNATLFTQQNGAYKWLTSASGTAGNAITFTQAMTLDASGRLGVGTTSPSNLLHVKLTSGGDTSQFEGAGASDSRINITNTGVSNTYLGFNNSGSTNGVGIPTGVAYFANGNSYPIAFSTNNTERARIASDGTFTFSNNTVFNGNVNTLKNTGELQWKDSSGTAQNVLFMFSDNDVMLSSPVAGSSILFRGAGYAERARIDSSGNLLVGTTSGSERLRVSATNNAAGFINTTAASTTAFCWNQATSGDNFFLEFATEGSFTSRGSIKYSRAGGVVLYNTTSDYRAKDIYGPITGSGALIDSVPVYMGKMKGATQERPMFIAHETPAYAHTGEKDAVDADGNPVYQQMDASALIPVMWAEIQSLRKRLADAGI
jgi:hypothetical protein